MHFLPSGDDQRANARHSSPQTPKMSDDAEQQPQSLRALFSGAEAKRKELESSYDSNSDAYQQKLTSAIATYEECLIVADRVSLFSPNETLEDVSSGDVQ